MKIVKELRLSKNAIGLMLSESLIPSNLTTPRPFCILDFQIGLMLELPELFASCEAVYKSFHVVTVAPSARVEPNCVADPSDPSNQKVPDVIDSGDPIEIDGLRPRANDPEKELYISYHPNDTSCPRAV